MKTNASLLSFLLLSATGSQGAPTTWTGATNGTWGTNTNWDTSAVPTSADDITILGPLNIAGALDINIAAAANAKSLNITNTDATTLSNTTSGANQTLTLQSGLAVGTGAVTIGSATANQSVNIALSASQTWAIGSGGLTATNVISGTGFGITKTGSGTLTLVGANTYTGATTISIGTLELQSAAISNFRSATTIASGATLKITSTAPTTYTGGNYNGLALGSALTSSKTTISGSGTLSITNAVALGNASGAGVNFAMGSGGLIDILAGGLLVNGGFQGGVWTSNLASMNIASGAAFDIWDGNPVTIDALTGSGTIRNGSNNAGVRTLTIGAANGSGTFSGNISATSIGGSNGGAGKIALTKVGTGTQVLSGTNTYSGATTVSGGMLTLNRVTGSLGATQLVMNGGTFNMDNVGASGALTLTLGALTAPAGDSTVKITRTVDFDQVLTFASLGSRTAGATLNFVNTGGTSSTTNGFNFTTRAAGFFDQGTFYNGSNYAWLNAANTYVRGIDYATDTDAESISASTASFTAGKLYEQIIGSGAITAQGTQTITTLNIANANNFVLGSGAALTVNGILKSGNAAGGTISGGTGIQAASGAELVIRTDAASDTLSINTPILANDASSLTKSGGGTLTLTGANTYTGATTISAGTLNVGVADVASTSGALGNGGNITFGGGTLQYSAASAGTDYSSRIKNSTAGAIAIDTNGQAVTFGTALASSNTGGLTKSGNGTLTFSGANTYTGATTINIGTLELQSAAISNFRSATTIASGATLKITSTAPTTYTGGNYNGLALGSAFTSSKTTISGSGTLSITNAVGLGNANGAGVNFAMGSGGLIDIQAGGLLVNGGFQGGTWTSNLASMNIGSGAAFDIWDGNPVTIDALTGSGTIRNGSNNTPVRTLTIGAANGSGTFSGNISATGIGGSNGGAGKIAITKIGSGTQTLSGNNTYTGATNVSGGKLVVTNSIGSSVVTVSNAGTTLASDAAATIGASLIVNDGAILAPGDAGAAGTATVSGNSTFNNASIFSWDINSSGNSYDKLITASLTDGGSTGGSIFRIVAEDATFANTFWSTTRTWTDILTTNGTTAISDWANVFSSVSVVNSGFNAITPGNGSFFISGNTLTWSAVPEPTSALAGILLTAGLLRRRRN